MNKFTNLLEKTAKEYNVMLEQEGMGAAGGAMDPANTASDNGAVAQPQMNAAPSQETGASTQKPVYDKPYMDLGKILYRALRVNFDDLEETAQRKILALKPQDIKSDEQAVSVFKTVERVMNEMDGPSIQGDIGGENEKFGPGV